MKIIKYGHILPQRTICIGCGAEYEFTPKDTKKRILGGILRYYVNCPVCDKPHILSGEESPANNQINK